jgi:hypothetical protein
MSFATFAFLSRVKTTGAKRRMFFPLPIQECQGFFSNRIPQVRQSNRNGPKHFSAVGKEKLLLC